MLPTSKNEHPKCVYLDQNKWIDLARTTMAGTTAVGSSPPWKG